MFLYLVSDSYGQDSEAESSSTSFSQQLNRYQLLDGPFKLTMLNAENVGMNIATYLLRNEDIAAAIYRQGLLFVADRGVSFEQFKKNLRRLHVFLKFAPNSEKQLLHQSSEIVRGRVSSQLGDVLAIGARKIYSLLFLSPNLDFGMAEYRFRVRSDYQLFIDTNGFPVAEQLLVDGGFRFAKDYSTRFVRWRSLRMRSTHINQRAIYQDFDDWLSYAQRNLGNSEGLLVDQFELDPLLLKHPAVFTGLWTQDKDLGTAIVRAERNSSGHLRFVPKAAALKEYFEGPGSLKEDEEPLDPRDMNHLADKRIIWLSLKLQNKSFQKKLKSDPHELAPQLGKALQANLPILAQKKIIASIAEMDFTKLHAETKKNLVEAIFYNILILGTEAGTVAGTGHFDESFYLDAFEVYFKQKLTGRSMLEEILTLAVDFESGFYHQTYLPEKEVAVTTDRIRDRIHSAFREIVENDYSRLRNKIRQEMKHKIRDKRIIFLNLLTRARIYHKEIVDMAFELLENPLQDTIDEMMMKGKTKKEVAEIIQVAALRYLSASGYGYFEKNDARITRLLINKPELRPIIFKVMHRKVAKILGDRKRKPRGNPEDYAGAGGCQGAFRSAS